MQVEIRVIRRLHCCRLPDHRKLNAGDSRCILGTNGKVDYATTDHKPDDPAELARIKKAGGEVMEGRINGNLNLSRAIGDL